MSNQKVHAVCQVAIGALGKGTQTKEMMGEAPGGELLGTDKDPRLETAPLKQCSQ